MDGRLEAQEIGDHTREQRGQPLLMREEGSATRRVTERVLQQASVRYETAMELDHTEAIKQAVMAWLGVAFLSIHAVGGEVNAGRLRALRLRGLRIQRHFHAIHSEGRALSASDRAFLTLLETESGAAGAPRHVPAQK